DGADRLPGSGVPGLRPGRSRIGPLMAAIYEAVRKGWSLTGAIGVSRCSCRDTRSSLPGKSELGKPSNEFTAIGLQICGAHATGQFLTDRNGQVGNYQRELGRRQSCVLLHCRREGLIDAIAGTFEKEHVDQVPNLASSEEGAELVRKYLLWWIDTDSIYVEL